MEAWPVKARVSGNVSMRAAPAPKAIQSQTANDSHPCSKHGSSGCSGTVGLDSDKTLGGMPSRSGFAHQEAPSSRTQKQSSGETILEPRIDRLSQHGRADGIPAGKLRWRAPFISGQSGLAEQVERQRYRVGNDGRQPDGRQDEDYDEPLPTPKKTSQPFRP